MLASMMRAGAAVVVALGFVGGVAAAPASAGCETNALGAQYCDGPPRPDGTWDRCVSVAPSPYFGQYGQVAGVHADHPDPGVVQSYSETFKLDRGDTSIPLTVTVTPQRGECRTAIVNATGDQLDSYSGPKEFTYKGVLSR